MNGLWRVHPAIYYLYQFTIHPLTVTELWLCFIGLAFNYSIANEAIEKIAREQLHRLGLPSRLQTP